jgi:hypothetical protein
MKIVGCSGVVLLAGALSLPAGAADWELNPTLEAGYLYDDNYRLASPGNEIRVSGPLADAQLEMRALTQTGEFSFTPRIRATYFPSETDLDAVDYFANVNWQHRGQGVVSRVDGEFSQQDIVYTEQADVDSGGDLGEPDFGDGGIVLVENRRTRASVRPLLVFEASPRKDLIFDAGFLDVSYDEQISTVQTDYTTADLSAGLRARLNETMTLTTRLRGAQYDMDNLSEKTNAYGAELQWDTRSVTETRTYLRAGAQNVEVSGGDTELAWVAGAGISKIIGRNELFADLARNVGPSSAGVIVTRDQLRLRLTRAMTPRLNFLVGIRGTHDEEVDPLSTFVPRSYATGDVGVEWRWQEEFSLRAAFDYTWQEFKDASTDATSSGATVSLVYQPQQRRRERND